MWFEMSLAQESGAEQVGPCGHREEFGFYSPCSLIMLKTGNSTEKTETS